MATSKSAQLQIRVSPDEKRRIQRAARRAGLDMSAYVLKQVLGANRSRVDALMRQLLLQRSRRYALAEIHTLLTELDHEELPRAFSAPPPASLDPETANYLAAMVEYACGLRAIAPPAWTRAIRPLDIPVFGSDLQSLRLHLLTHSPPPFRRRNLFIDTSIGGQV